MSETRFTPGPWKVFQTKDGRVLLGVGDKDAGGVTDCGDISTNDLGVWRSGSEKWANAHLIAAAPEMYDALTDIEWSGLEDREEGGYERSCPFCSSTSDLGHNDACKVAAALAKARGEA